jgi:predicted RNA-binding Zn-ribbon protein involved in translation (DUF1610 family)
MEEGAKKTVMVGVVVLCLVGAVMAYLMFKPESLDDRLEPFSGEMMWVKCVNENCGAEYQVDKADYFKFVEQNAVGTTTPAMKCKECGEESIYRAVKCEKCGHVFLRGLVRGDFADRCPKCSHSTIEESRKRASQQ